MNTRQKACRIVCPAKTRFERANCRVWDGQCANARKIQEGLDRVRVERKQGKAGVSWADPYADKG
jgi:hypothetical protein